MSSEKIFIGSLSSFISEENKYQITAAEQLEHLFIEYGIDVLKNPKKQLIDKRINLLSTVFFVIYNIRKISIAILPLFGTYNSILWYRILNFIFKLFNKKVICFVRGGTIPAQIDSGENKFYKIFRNADVVVAPSAFIQKVLANKKIDSLVIENPIAIGNYPFSNKSKASPHILWMRSFHDTYNPLMAVKVAKYLSLKYPDFKMAMAGNDRGMQSKTLALVNEYGLNNKISFPGYIDNSMKQKLSKEYDIFISTNRVDNAPVSLIEFMSLGLPIVAVNTGGIPFIISDGVNGLLTPMGNEKIMSDKISSIIENPYLFNDIRNNARQYSLKYDQGFVINKWKTLFATIVKQNNKKIFVASLSSWLTKEKKFQLTASDQLTELFLTKQLPVYKRRHRSIKLINLLGTILFIFTKRNQISAGVLPLYGTSNSIRWYKLLSFILKTNGIKIICVIHGGSIPEQLANGEDKFDRIFQKADAIVTPSRFINQSLLKKNISSIVIKNPVSIKLYKFINKDVSRPTILWMRSFHETYNPLMAVRVAGLLAKKYPSFKMIMAGNDRGLLSATKSLVRALKLEDKIVFPGYIDLKQKEELATECDFYISTNKIDNAPVSIIEYMALGLPVVAVNTGGIPFIIKHKENGLLVPEDDDKAMADSISNLLEDQQLFKSLRNNARKYALMYDEDIVLEKWKSLFKEMGY